MKTTILSALLAFAISIPAIAQDVTTVNATSTEISDNLDLRAVASIFGDAANLEDFERKLNDPELQISNLDLNNDNQVDYLRVIESVEGNTHLIIIQSVLARDVYQDVATVEVERDSNNNVQVQVVGDVYMYGPNYIYEPVYVHHPVFFTSFWIGSYRPYNSGWYWGYYPSYYHVWQPYPVFRYRRNVHVHINVVNQYNYVNVRRSSRAVALYNGRRANGYERQYPNRSFQQRHANVTNRYELDQKRNARNSGVRSGLTAGNPRNAGTRANSNTRTEAAAVRSNNSVRSNGVIKSENNSTPRANSGTRSQTSTPRANSGIRTESATPRENNSIKTRDNQSAIQNNTPRANSAVQTRDNQSTRVQNNTPRVQSAPAQTRIQSSTPRQTAAPAATQMQSAPRNNNAQRVQSQGNAGRAQQMGDQRQSQGGRNSQGRR
jgi:hypothetical protein